MAIIFVPGIKGSKLADTYPLDHKVRWSLEDLVVGDLWEDPLDFELRDGLFDKAEHHLFREWELINFAYRKMIDRLRKRVDPQLYTFPYDWRKPLEVSAENLVEFIDHIRGKLRVDGVYPRLSFVTHSMGGLVLRSALGLRGADPFGDIERIVFVAPPFRGSCEIPRALIAGEKNGWLSEEEEFRKLARSFPAVYQLVPSFAEAAVAAETGVDLDLFDSANWQQNVQEGEEFQAGFLRNAEVFVRDADADHGGVSAAPMISEAKLRQNAEKVLVLLGVGYPTVYRVPVVTRNPNNANWFDFRRQMSDKRGDKRVHLKSCAISGVTLAAFRDVKSHGRVCQDSKIIKAVEMWLRGRRLLKMKPRTPRHTVGRGGRDYFDPWDGNEDSWHRHIV